jgi:hypothetical protein
MSNQGHPLSGPGEFINDALMEYGDVIVSDSDSDLEILELLENSYLIGMASTNSKNAVDVLKSNSNHASKEHDDKWKEAWDNIDSIMATRNATNAPDVHEIGMEKADQIEGLDDDLLKEVDLNDRVSKYLQNIGIISHSDSMPVNGMHKLQRIHGILYHESVKERQELEMLISEALIDNAISEKRKVIIQNTWKDLLLLFKDLADKNLVILLPDTISRLVISMIKVEEFKELIDKIISWIVYQLILSIPGSLISHSISNCLQQLGTIQPILVSSSLSSILHKLHDIWNNTSICFNNIYPDAPGILNLDQYFTCLESSVEFLCDSDQIFLSSWVICTLLVYRDSSHITIQLLDSLALKFYHQNASNSDMISIIASEIYRCLHIIDCANILLLGVPSNRHMNLLFSSLSRLLIQDLFDLEIFLPIRDVLTTPDWRSSIVHALKYIYRRLKQGSMSCIEEYAKFIAIMYTCSLWIKLEITTHANCLIDSRHNDASGAFKKLETALSIMQSIIRIIRPKPIPKLLEAQSTLSVCTIMLSLTIFTNDMAYV